MQTWLNLQDKIIIVTGGASGIGLAIVDELLAQGANVQMVDIHGGDGQYEGHKGYQFWPTDISSAKEVNHTVAEIIQRFGRIDGLVNNAGVNFPRLLVDEKAPAGQYELNEAAFEKNGQYQPERRFSDVAGGGATDGQTTRWRDCECFLRKWAGRLRRPELLRRH